MTPTNALAIVEELSEWVMGVDTDIARHAVRAIGEIAVRAPPHIRKILDKLVTFWDVSSEICSEVVKCLKDLLRKYPQWAKNVVESTSKKFSMIDDAEGKASVIWMIGEFGELLDQGPYILENLVAGYSEEPDRNVRLELLTAAVKLFLKRAPECQRMLGQLFVQALGEGDSPGELDTDVHDRALMFYRLLQVNLQQARETILCEKAKIGTFVAGEGGIGDRLFPEFNSLSIIYNKPQNQFTESDYRWVVVNQSAEPRAARAPTPAPAPAPTANTGSADVLGDFFGGSPSPAPAPVAAPAASNSSPVDVLGDLFGSSPSPAPAPAPVAAEIQLDPSRKMNQATFQGGWKSNPVTGKVLVMVGAQNVPKVKAALARAGILVRVATCVLPRSFVVVLLFATLIVCVCVLCFQGLAFKDMGKAYKLFMYAHEVAPASGQHLLTVMIEKATGRFIAQVKTIGGTYSLFEAKLKATLGSL